MKYVVYVEQRMSTAVEIEADSYQEAVTKFNEQGLPRDHVMDEAGELEVLSVSNAQHEVVWEADVDDMIRRVRDA